MPSDFLDALTAAPEHHRLAYEDERVRVLETIIQPGDKTPLHTHCYPSTLYVLSGSDFIRRDENGNVLLDSRTAGIRLEPGNAMWSGALGPHTLENVGSKPIHIIATEIKLSLLN